MAAAEQKHLQLDFTFSVVSDDGNLPSALVSGASDLINQSFKEQRSVGNLWSCMLLLHDGITSGNDDSTDEWIIDPSVEECQNLSNNLVMVTAFKQSGDDDNVTYMIEKGTDALRTSYSL